MNFLVGKFESPSLQGIGLLGLKWWLCHNKGGTADIKSFVPININLFMFIGTRDFFIAKNQEHNLKEEVKWKTLKLRV